MTVKVGDYVSFQFRGEEFRGTVSSIYEEKGQTFVCGTLNKDSLFGVN